MKNNIEKEIKLLEQKAHFKLTSEERIKFEKELIEFKEAFKSFDTLELNDIEEAYLPFEITSTYLRDDNIIENNSWDFLKNSKKFCGGFISLEGDKESEK